MSKAIEAAANELREAGISMATCTTQDLMNALSAYDAAHMAECHGNKPAASEPPAPRMMVGCEHTYRCAYHVGLHKGNNCEIPCAACGNPCRDATPAEIAAVRALPNPPLAFESGARAACMGRSVRCAQYHDNIDRPPIGTQVTLRERTPRGWWTTDTGTAVCEHCAAVIAPPKAETPRDFGKVQVGDVVEPKWKDWHHATVVCVDNGMCLVKYDSPECNGVWYDRLYSANVRNILSRPDLRNGDVVEYGEQQFAVQSSVRGDKWRYLSPISGIGGQQIMSHRLQSMHQRGDIVRVLCAKEK